LRRASRALFEWRKSMGIFGALTTAVTGMRAQSYALENISGNIANSQTTGFKRIDTMFEDLIPESVGNAQLSGSVTAMSRLTNTVQGDIQSSSIPTFMAINGNGYFVIQKPSNFTDGRPVFSGVDMYTRRGDFQLDQNGYLVNGAGYYLSGIPIDATTGNLVGSVPQTLQFQNGFLPAQKTTSIDYHANLAGYPLTNDHDKTITGSELLNPANFSANPINGAAVAAKIIGAGGTLLKDAAALVTGSVNVAALDSAGGSISINGTPIAIAAHDDAAAVVAKINLQTATTHVTATLNASNKIELKSDDAKTEVKIDNTSTLSLLDELGYSVGITNPTNILTQGAAGAGDTLEITIGGNPKLTLLFGPGNIETIADLNTELGLLTGGSASATVVGGNITISATNPNDKIEIGGSVDPKVFGIHTLEGLPSNGSVVGQDVTTFLNESLGGGAVTVYDVSGAAVNVQLRWAKVDSATLGGAHKDVWNLFYQSSSDPAAQDKAWINAGVDYTFSANGQLDPAINATTLTNCTVDGVPLGNLRIVHGTNGITQFADPNGNAQVNLLQQNGFAAGQLEGISVSDKGRVVGTYSNGRTLDLAEVTLAQFSGANFLNRVDGGAFEATSDSGPPTYGSAGKISGSSLEGSNVDIADEFTKLIVTQQAYSANTRVVTTSNQMVQDLLNMLR
jgi:flagellar hook protein FlgE